MPDHRPYRKWYMHRRDALRRGIPFELDFETWMQLWLDSGHWHERGKKKGQYVMARPSDRGSYAVGNVKIVLQEDNTREACLGHKLSPEQCELRRRNRLGKTHSEETKAKIRASNIVAHQSKELKKRIAAARKASRKAGNY